MFFGSQHNAEEDVYDYDYAGAANFKAKSGKGGADALAGRIAPFSPIPKPTSKTAVSFSDQGKPANSTNLMDKAKNMLDRYSGKQPANHFKTKRASNFDEDDISLSEEEEQSSDVNASDSYAVSDSFVDNPKGAPSARPQLGSKALQESEEEEEEEQSGYSDEEFDDNEVLEESMAADEENASYSRIGYGNEEDEDDDEVEEVDASQSSKPKIMSFADFAAQSTWDGESVEEVSSSLILQQQHDESIRTEPSAVLAPAPISKPAAPAPAPVAAPAPSVKEAVAVPPKASMPSSSPPTASAAPVSSSAAAAAVHNKGKENAPMPAAPQTAAAPIAVQPSAAAPSAAPTAMTPVLPTSVPVSVPPTAARYPQAVPVPADPAAPSSVPPHHDPLHPPPAPSSSAAYPYPYPHPQQQYGYPPAPAAPGPWPASPYGYPGYPYPPPPPTGPMGMGMGMGIPQQQHPYMPHPYCPPPMPYYDPYMMMYPAPAPMPMMPSLRSSGTHGQGQAQGLRRSGHSDAGKRVSYASSSSMRLAQSQDPAVMELVTELNRVQEEANWAKKQLAETMLKLQGSRETAAAAAVPAPKSSVKPAAKAVSNKATSKYNNESDEDNYSDEDEEDEYSEDFEVSKLTITSNPAPNPKTKATKLSTHDEDQQEVEEAKASPKMRPPAFSSEPMGMRGSAEQQHEHGHRHRHSQGNLYNEDGSHNNGFDFMPQAPFAPMDPFASSIARSFMASQVHS